MKASYSWQSSSSFVTQKPVVFLEISKNNEGSTHFLIDQVNNGEFGVAKQLLF